MSKDPRSGFPPGFSLISVLVAVAITGIIAVVTSQIASNGFAGQKSLGFRNDIESIRQSVLKQVSCAETLKTFGTPAVCGFVDLKDKKGKFVMKKDPTATGVFANSGPIAGDWYAKASCGASSVVIQVARRKKGTWMPMPDPLNAGKVWDFTSGPTNPLFGDDVGSVKSFKLCEDYFTDQPFFDLACVSSLTFEPFGAASDSTHKNKCPLKSQIMTECRTILYPSGQIVCGSNTAVGRDPADGKVYCTTHGCGAVTGERWGTQVTCCSIVH